MFSTGEITTILQEIQQAELILITTHRSPDADAMGSSLGLQQILSANTPAKVIALVPDAFPDFLNWMPGAPDALVYDQQTETGNALLRQANLIFCLDYNHPSRTGSMEMELRKAPGLKVMIDHHQEPDHFAQYRWSDTAASSTCELVVSVMDTFGWAKVLNQPIATCLYTGIMTDTGSFRFSATTAHTHRVISRLMETGIQQWKIHESLFNQNTFEKLRLWGHAFLNKLKVMPEFRTAYIYLKEEELKLFGFREGDLEGLVNFALSIRGVTLGALFSERGGKIRISFRSVGSFSVNRFARLYFNGGGHENAAGGSSQITMEETLEQFETLLQEYRDELNAQ